MPTPTKGARLGGNPAHQRLILSNLASQLFEHGKITTTEAKAKRLRPLAERLITKAKRGDLHARRQVLQKIGDRSVVHVLFTEIAPMFAERDGGYLRITKIGPRKGDSAPMAAIELVTESVEESKKANGKNATKKAAQKTAPAATGPEASAAAAAELAATSETEAAGGNESVEGEPAPTGEVPDDDAGAAENPQETGEESGS